MPLLATTARKLVNAIPSVTSRPMRAQPMPRAHSTGWGERAYPNVKRTDEAHDGRAVSAYRVDRHFHAAKADCSPHQFCTRWYVRRRSGPGPRRTQSSATPEPLRRAHELCNQISLERKSQTTGVTETPLPIAPVIDLKVGGVGWG
jgi:hypothetical protein